MYYDEKRKKALELVRIDGRNLQLLDSRFRDDLEIVATAILGREFGGISVLHYASERLQNNRSLLELTKLATELQKKRIRIESIDISLKQKDKEFQLIEDKKISIIQKYFRGKDYYLQFVQLPDSLKKNIERGIVGTIHNYPNSNILNNLANCIYSFLDDYLENRSTHSHVVQDSELFDYISRKNHYLNITLRDSLSDYYSTHNSYQVVGEFGKNHHIDNISLPSSVLFALDIIKISLGNISQFDDKSQKLFEFLEVFDLYLASSQFARENVEDSSLMIQSRNRLIQLWKKLSVDDISFLLYNYFNSLKLQDVFSNGSIDIHHVSNTGMGALTNSNGLSLRDSFYGVLLDGRIDMASDKGFRSSKSKQQDAIGSFAFDDRHFITIVADGVGGYTSGEKASKYLVERLLSWYQSVPDYCLEDLTALIGSLEDEVRNINLEIINQYHGSSQTTMVVSIVAGDHTIFANVGDSTAYTYDEGKDQLIELSTLDSVSFGLSYEQARHNPNNNVITASIGSHYDSLHIHVIENNGQRVILSSDGVTDLIREEYLKACFINKFPSYEVVRKAKFYPDVDGTMTGVDNISAIVIDLPANHKSLHGRRF